MNTLQKIDVNPNKGDLITLVSNFGSGKTTLLSLIATELALSGKRVLFISEEMSIRHLSKKIANVIDMLPFDKELTGNLIGNFVLKNTSHALEYVEEKVKDNFEYIILDGYFGNKADLRLLAQKKGVIIIETHQANREGGISDERNAYRADALVHMERTKEFTELSFLTKVKNKLFFWLEKTEPIELINLNVLKNRTGKTGKHKVELNYAKINKQ